MAEGPKHFQQLLHAEGLSLGVWNCQGDNQRPGAEQYSPSPTINIPLRGLFARHGPGGTQVIDPMTVSLSNAGEVWRSSHPGPCGDAGIYVRLEVAAVEATLPSQTDHDAGAPFTEGYRRLDAAEWLAWAALVADARSGDLSAAAALDATLRLVERLGRAPALPDHAHALTRAARAVLARESMAIPALARNLGVSPFHLCRSFRRATGHTIHAWDEGLRLRRAAAHLEAGGRDLTTVALDHGFSSHAHFSTRFHRAFGLTPSAWRARS